MEPIAVGFMVLVGTAAFIGVVVGAIGGAVAWRLGTSRALGGLLTAGGLLVVLVAEGDGSLTWLRPKLTWGVPWMAFTFLVASASARWLQGRTTLSRNAMAAVAFAVALILGLSSLRLVGLSLRAPLLATVGVGGWLILLAIRDRSRR